MIKNTSPNIKLLPVHCTTVCSTQLSPWNTSKGWLIFHYRQTSLRIQDKSFIFQENKIWGFRKVHETKKTLEILFSVPVVQHVYTFYIGLAKSPLGASIRRYGKPECTFGPAQYFHLFALQMVCTHSSSFFNICFCSPSPVCCDIELVFIKYIFFFECVGSRERRVTEVNLLNSEAVNKKCWKCFQNAW